MKSVKSKAKTVFVRVYTPHVIAPNRRVNKYSVRMACCPFNGEMQFARAHMCTYPSALHCQRTPPTLEFTIICSAQVQTVSYAKSKKAVMLLWSSHSSRLIKLQSVHIVSPACFNLIHGFLRSAQHTFIERRTKQLFTLVVHSRAYSLTTKRARAAFISNTRPRRILYSTHNNHHRRCVHLFDKSCHREGYSRTIASWN